MMYTLAVHLVAVNHAFAQVLDVIGGGWNGGGAAPDAAIPGCCGGTGADCMGGISRLFVR